MAIQALRGCDCHKREHLPASQRQTHLHATCTAGKTRRGTEAGPGRRGFSDHCRHPHRICGRNNSAKRFGSGRVGFWTRHRRASYPCFCWMPTVTSPKTHGLSRSVSPAAKKDPLSTASAWEKICGTTICKRVNTYFPVGATFFGPFTNT